MWALWRRSSPLERFDVDVYLAATLTQSHLTLGFLFGSFIATPMTAGDELGGNVQLTEVQESNRVAQTNFILQKEALTR